MDDGSSDWRPIAGVLVGVVAVLVVAAFVIWVVFYGYLTSFSEGPSATGTASGRTSSVPAVIGGAAAPVVYTTPSGVYVSLSPQAW